ncbi:MULTISPECIES: hypothetical protein [Proteus]|uniref:Uncharacterized protein n=1 Tax=Proteus terrae subsp. cibarius TaxID=626774 RepID=A0A6G6ST60_9GAMM|nr:MULTISPECIES: hypothetical protein [Proteus]QHP76307.1 hypothetical protein EKQ45_10205 [Proteus vulgaris]MBG2912961.1 hypothetical protein [Proteus terrae subsp. cibarius]MCM2365940.1 hypothetical protein [Proteus sp. FZP2095]QIF97918.1 hypothetical protein GTH25_07585 [Proteus terrae subsp. cibarius]WCG91978.1 hypothetical protein ONR67_08145 [Proteus terrae]
MLTSYKFNTTVLLIAGLLLSGCDNNSTSETSNDIRNIPIQAISGFNMAYPTSFTMSREDTENYFKSLPDNVQDVTTEMMVYKSEPICDLTEVRLVYFKMIDVMSYDVDAGAQGIVDNIAIIDGMNEISTSIKPLTIPNVESRHVFFEGKYAKENVSYEGILAADLKTNRVWQLQLISNFNSQSNKQKNSQILECTNKYIQTITINK